MDEVEKNNFIALPRASQVVLVVKNIAANSGDIRCPGSILGSERSLGKGDGKPLQYSCLENPWMEELGGLHSLGRKESDTTE